MHICQVHGMQVTNWAYIGGKYFEFLQKSVEELARFSLFRYGLEKF